MELKKRKSETKKAAHTYNYYSIGIRVIYSGGISFRIQVLVEYSYRIICNNNIIIRGISGTDTTPVRIRLELQYYYRGFV